MDATTITLTIREAAEHLKISQRFLAKLIADRHLPSLKLGRRRLIRQDALRDFLLRQETDAR